MSDSKFFKGIDEHYLGDSPEERKLAAQSIYYLWWQLARAHPVLWYARTPKAKPVDHRIQDVLDKFGDLSDKRFEVWWQETGRMLFAEPEAMRAVQMIKPKVPLKSFHPEAVVFNLQVALVTDKRTILNEFRKLLDKEFLENELKPVANYSQALFPLHTVDFDEGNIRTAWMCWLYRSLYPLVPLWVIGDRLGLLPDAKVRNSYGVLDIKTNSKAKAANNTLRVTVDRALNNGKRLMNNLVIGKFPCYEDIGEIKQPFGSKAGKKFNTATVATGNAWQQWLAEEYKPRLFEEVRNKAVRLAPAGYPRTDEYVEAFVSGSSHLW